MVAPGRGLARDRQRVATSALRHYSECDRVSSMTIATLTRSRHSPCIGVCKLAEQTGLCLGCARTGMEIAAWSSLDEAGRDAIWQQLPARAASLALRVRLMPWTGGEIIEWTAGTIADRLGTWVTGMPGAVAEFPCRPD